MSQNKLVLTLVSIVAVLIVGMSIFVFTHTSGIDLTQGILLIAVATSGLLIVLGVIYIIVRSVRSQK